MPRRRAGPSPIVVRFTELREHRLQCRGVRACVDVCCLAAWRRRRPASLSASRPRPIGSRTPSPRPSHALASRVRSGSGSHVSKRFVKYSRVQPYTRRVRCRWCAISVLSRSRGLPACPVAPCRTCCIHAVRCAARDAMADAPRDLAMRSGPVRSHSPAHASRPGRSRSRQSRACGSCVRTARPPRQRCIFSRRFALAYDTMILFLKILMIELPHTRLSASRRCRPASAAPRAAVYRVPRPDEAVWGAPPSRAAVRHKRDHAPCRL